MKNYKLIVGYDGTDFRGWQRQPDGRTVQGVLEEAVRKVTQKRTVVHGAGRTDAGVHALGQVAGFRGAFKLSDEVLLRALNAVLPQDVRVFSLEEAPADFHARRSARSKVYRYRIVNAPQPSPLDRRYVLHWPYPLKIGKMRQAAALFVRTADFTRLLLEPRPLPRPDHHPLGAAEVGRRDRLHDRRGGLSALHGPDDRRDAPRGRAGADRAGRGGGDLPAQGPLARRARRPRPRA